MNLEVAIAAQDAPGMYIRMPFQALLDGTEVVVTAVLDRTAVYHRGDITDRHLALLARFEPVGELEWHLEPANSARLSSKRGRQLARAGRRGGGPTADRWMAGWYRAGGGRTRGEASA